MTAQANSQVPSLSDCLEVGPPLKPMILDISSPKSLEVAMNHRRHSKGLPPD